MIEAVLREDGRQLVPDDLHRLASEIDYSRRARQRGLRYIAQYDIIKLAEEARDEKDLDEAVWRAFIAVHFGRLSARQGAAQSAGLFLCNFGQLPHWTWTRVLSEQKTFFDWLRDEPRLRGLRFGNHRKHERTNQLRRVFKELVEFIKKFGRPSSTIKTPGAADPYGRFDALMNKINTFRFGRLGNFDLIDLLVQLKLVDAEPENCYLRGSSGPQ